jgi:hypothetical protein
MYDYLSRQSFGGYHPSPRESSLRYAALEGKMARLERRVAELEEVLRDGSEDKPEAPLKSAEQADRAVRESAAQILGSDKAFIDAVLAAWLSPLKYSR